MKRSLPIIEKLLVALIAALFLTPLALTLFFQFWSTTLPQTAWLRNDTLVGVSTKHPAPVFTWARVRSGDYQKDLAGYFNEDFAGRELLIRLTCEAWTRVFKISPMKSGGGSLILGRDNFIFEEAYLLEYCFSRTSREKLEPLVRDIRRLQDVCARIGIGFVVMLTPSKAAILPDHIPLDWLERYDPRPRSYDYFVPLLKEYEIHFVDGHVLTRQAMSEVPAPIFPKGGIHWGQYAASKTTNALIAALQAQGKPLQPVVYSAPHVSHRLEGEDGDVMGLMNLAVPWRYPVAKVKIKPFRSKQGAFPNMTFVAGSFANEVVRQLSTSNQTSEINRFFYYNLIKFCNYRENINAVRQPVNGLDFNREIFATDCLVLEVNEQAIGLEGPYHLLTFVRDALKHIDDGKLIHRPFLYESFLPCEWGQKISFYGANNPLVKKPAWSTGFAAFGDTYSWTSPVATVRLSIPPTSNDILLEAEVGTLLHPQKLPTQTAKIYVNDQHVGEWNFTAGEGQVRRQITLPKELLRAPGVFSLRFEVKHPATPVSLGIDGNPTFLGLSLSSLHLSESPRQIR